MMVPHICKLLQPTNTATRWKCVAIMLVVFGCTGLFLNRSATAQDVQLRAQRGPYYAGDPVVVQVVVRGQQPSDKVTCTLQGDPPTGVSIQGPQMSRSSRSFTQIINGRISSNESVDVIFSFLVTATREGRHTAGPFKVTINGKQQTVAGEAFNFIKLDNDPDMRLALELPGKTFYEGQRVPVTLRWSFAGELNAVQYAFSNLQIRSPLFDQLPLAKQTPKTRTTLTIATAAETIDLDATVKQETIDGRAYYTVTAATSFLAESPGSYDNVPVTCRTEKVAQWRRDIFGDLTPGQRRPALATGAPVSFVIKPIPSAGRPATFTGAVGAGFSLTAAANRSIVRLGDPISLTVSIRGQGDLSRVSLPPLDAGTAWPTAAFQLPDEPASGTVSDSTKQFTLNVRVQATTVKQIPPIEFSWFDPHTARFVTAKSKPIALQVLDNKVVSADDVVAATPPGNTVDSPSKANRQNATGRTADPMSFVGADLAIETEPSRLLANASYQISPVLLAGIIYVLAFLTVVTGLVWQHRSRRDPHTVRRVKQLRSMRQQLDNSRGQPPHEAAVQIADTLRQAVAEFAPDNRAAIESVIAQCETVIFARDANAHRNLDDLVEQAQQLVSTIPKP